MKGVIAALIAVFVIAFTILVFGEDINSYGEQLRAERGAGDGEISGDVLLTIVACVAMLLWLVIVWSWG